MTAEDFQAKHRCSPEAVADAIALGAVFEPNPEVLWVEDATSHWGAIRVLADGTEQHNADGRQWKNTIPGSSCHPGYRTALIQRLLAEHKAKQVVGEGLEALAHVFRKRAPKTPTVQAFVNAFSTAVRRASGVDPLESDIAMFIHALRAAGLPEGEPAPGGEG